MTSTCLHFAHLDTADPASALVSSAAASSAEWFKISPWHHSIVIQHVLTSRCIDTSYEIASALGALGLRNYLDTASPLYSHDPNIHRYGSIRTPAILKGATGAELHLDTKGALGVFSTGYGEPA